MLARFDFGTLIVILIFASPLIRAAIESARKAREARERGGPRPAPRPARGPRPQAGPVAQGKPMTWQDLMSGLGQAPAATPAQPPPVPAARPEARPEVPPHFDPEVEFRDEWHEHEAPMVPTKVLGRAPSEDELERHGGDLGRPLTELPGLAGASLASKPGESRLEGGLTGELSAAHTARTGPRRHRTSFAASGWRRALVQAELLAGPIALRDGRVPGPFGSPPGLGRRRG